MLRGRSLLLAAIFIVAGSALAASPYVGETSRGIKALSEQEIADYISGKGIGFAKAGYAGAAGGHHHQ